MELREIKGINQRIYELDTDITRSSKVIFIATILFCITKNKDFLNANKLTTLIDFTSEKKKPIDQLIDLAKTEIKELNLQKNTEKAIMDSLKTIEGVSTGLDKDRTRFKDFLYDFITKWFPSIKPSDLFLETLYMEIDKKAKNSDTGVVLTPIFAAELMVDLADIDYKKDIIADLCSGTGLFSLLSYSKMLKDMDNDLTAKKISNKEYNEYKDRLYNSIVANDNDAKMVTLCLANFLLKTLNHTLVYNEDVLKIQKSTLKYKNMDKELQIKPTKAILNPPYEDKYKPLEILEKNIEIIKDDENMGNRCVVIIPPQKFGQKKDVFSRILNIATLELVIKMQDDLFTDSGKGQPASIFVFNASKPHDKKDKIRYFNFTDTGYVYLKDSGLVDKNNTYNEKKTELLKRIKKKSNMVSKNEFERNFDNFYEVNKELEIEASINPLIIATNKEEADITLENITIKKMLTEKKKLIDGCQNSFVDEDGRFEKYIIDILSED